MYLPMNIPQYIDRYNKSSAKDMFLLLYFLIFSGILSNNNDKHFRSEI